MSEVDVLTGLGLGHEAPSGPQASNVYFNLGIFSLNAIQSCMVPCRYRTISDYML